MKVTLSIITINKNNAIGLEKTIKSVLTQTSTNFEYIIIDGASTDNSIDIIKANEPLFGGRLKWVSEPDKGIYNAMNKGINMATGEYLQFLNSGDCLAGNDVVEKMLCAVESNDKPAILYGNMLKVFNNGRIVNDHCFNGSEISFLGFYTGTLNHSPAYIRRNLFEKYGFYDESLKIVSDWKWYLKAIIFGDIKPAYTNIDVTLFDMYGISETNKSLDKAERRKVLEELIPSTILKDYDDFHFNIEQFKRLKRHPWAFKFVYFLERCLFKYEKLKDKSANIQQYK